MSLHGAVGIFELISPKSAREFDAVSVCAPLATDQRSLATLAGLLGAPTHVHFLCLFFRSLISTN
jgi:hypothetical protein